MLSYLLWGHSTRVSWINILINLMSSISTNAPGKQSRNTEEIKSQTQKSMRLEKNFHSVYSISIPSWRLLHPEIDRAHSIDLPKSSTNTNYRKWTACTNLLIRLCKQNDETKWVFIIIGQLSADTFVEWKGNLDMTIVSINIAQAIESMQNI